MFDAKGKKQYRDFLKSTLFTAFPKEFFTLKGSNGKETFSMFIDSRSYFASNIVVDGVTKKRVTEADKKEFKDLLNNHQKFGPPLPNGIDLGYVRDYGTGKSKFLKNWDGMVEGSLNGELNKMNESNMLLGKTMWDRIFDAIQKNPSTFQGFQSFLSRVGNMTSHPMKMMAPVIGGTIGYESGGENITWEHARPATDTYNVLLRGALAFRGNKAKFDKLFKEMMNNYKVLALDKIEDGKLDDANLTTKMPEGVTEWYRRYANELVGAIDGGINGNNIFLLDNIQQVFSFADEAHFTTMKRIMLYIKQQKQL